MSKLSAIEPKRVFHYFEKICSIPHGSGDMSKIADYCENFAKENSLGYVRDEADNIIIFKPAAKGYENSATIILQGHLDMVCQKAENVEKNFVEEGIEPYIDGDFIKARGTTLGADNGIAVAMILAILESKEYRHPPIEAVFTVDEEIGLLGAVKLDTSVLKGKRMINIDSEEEDCVTVSCAGGRDFCVTVPVEREEKSGALVAVTFKGLQGGHSGVEIHKGRINANILMGRFLNRFINDKAVSLISLSGGDKSNAIANLCKAELLVDDEKAFTAEAEGYLQIIKNEIYARESGFAYEIADSGRGNKAVLTDDAKKDIIRTLVVSPQGVVDMSAEIEGLAETSLNLGILKTNENSIYFHYSFRSNKKSAIDFLQEKMTAIFSTVNCSAQISGSYPSWEYNAVSPLRDLYCECYRNRYGKNVKIEAIHAGLECGVFDSKIEDLDCISVGPDMFDVHTFNERLSIPSAENIFSVIVDVLEKSI